MDIVVKGRHTAVPERFRRHVQAKLAKLERLDSKVMLVDVELSKEHNPRLSDTCDRVELTVYSRGPVIRAEAAAADAYAALDRATAKLAERLRRASDRRVRHHANHAGANHPVPGRAGAVPDIPAVPTGRQPETDTAGPPVPGAEDGAAGLAAVGSETRAKRSSWSTADDGDGDDSDYSPMVVREKTHAAAPMTLDDALSNMELVGHDFYLFLDAASGLPSVVYRRCGYDYGVIRLEGAAGDSMIGARERTAAVISAV
ncbi:ribosome-associated translation inhibitor RaiA [Parafrankia sp. FMc6]|uniref:ribosome hibernation-promoting factor, HPF/YfiA family n=1 Tax=Parafrankia soli TaxID=2599596 RepID=UPI0034D48848